MMNIRAFNLCLALAALALPAQAIEQSALAGGTGSHSLLENSMHTGMVNAALQSMAARMRNILNCQALTQVWNGTSCIAVFAEASSSTIPMTGTSVAMQTQMNPAITIQGSVLVPNARYHVNPGTQKCGFFGISTCTVDSCMQPQTCPALSLQPTVQQVNNVLVITPRVCQTTYVQVPC